jgi:folate-binding protein YgfZ
MNKDLASIRFNSSQTELKNYSLIEVTGKDREAFFQGQVTNDIYSLNFGESHLTARLNRTGKLQSFFTLARLKDKLLLLCEDVLVESILIDFNKFIVMDEVELNKSEEKIYVHLNYFLNKIEIETENLFILDLYGISSAVSTAPFLKIPESNMVELENIRVLNGYPKWNHDVDSNNFINDTILNSIAISYKKGCFLGQETVAKIENNRGAAYYPVLLKLLKSKTIVPKIEFTIDAKKAGIIKYQVNEYLLASLLRDYRVEGKNIFINISNIDHECCVQYLPFYKNQKRFDVASELYHFGVEEFQKENTELAMDFMKKAIEFNPEFSDAYESIGVILGRKDRFIEAIEWMDKLLEIKSTSVMAHTNKSLFLMKLGKIEEAEAEKSLATIKSFSMFGEESKLKKIVELEKIKKEEDIIRREKMFLNVIEIDADDTIALFGMADIAFYRGNFEKAVTLLEKVVSVDEKYSTAYLLLGKSLEASGDKAKAQSAYNKGIEVASKRGDMMPANEMQSRLNQLVMTSRLT